MSAKLADFTALNDPEHRRRVEREGGYFVVEGVLAIERLLTLPQWHVRTLALLPRVAERLAPLIDPAVDVVVATEAELRDVVGFDIHRGALASVDRRPAAALDDVLDHSTSTGTGPLLLVAQGVNDHENMGALYRNAAAFGCAAVLLDPTCADPFYRRSVRVSLGNVLAVPTVEVPAGSAGMGLLRDHGVTTVALSPRGDTPLADLSRATLGQGTIAVVVGAEGPGLAPATLHAAEHRASIPMAADVDSLNVATAAAVALFQLAG